LTQDGSLALCNRHQRKIYVKILRELRARCLVRSELYLQTWDESGVLLHSCEAV
jgi:hypothetical protein